MTTLYQLKDVSGLYVDAAVGNAHNELCFLSVWGLETAIQEFLGRLSLSHGKGGMVEVKIISVETPHKTESWYGIVNPGLLQKSTGRALSRHSIFHGLVHLWIYQQCMVKMDYANRQCWLLKQHTEKAEVFAQRLWAAVKTVCPVPLLDSWQSLVDAFYQQDWIQHYPGIKLDAYHLNFKSEEVEQFISSCIKQGKLTLPNQDKQKSHLSLVEE